MSAACCARCQAALGAHVTSYFNLDVICLDCVDRERAHPRYAAAKQAEIEACLAGDFNFPGVGAPPELYLPQERGEGEKDR